MLNKDQNLCPGCRIFKEICLCGHIRKFALKTRLTLLIHAKEIKRITNTGRFALYSLENSKAILKGDRDSLCQPHELVPDEYQSILLTPHAPTILNQSIIQSISKPINLIVPDGTWQQVRRMVSSEKKLYEIPHFKLPAEDRVFSTLRNAPYEEFIPTLAAISHALGIIENHEIQEYFENLLQIMTQRLKKRLYRKSDS